MSNSVRTLTGGLRAAMARAFCILQLAFCILAYSILANSAQAAAQSLVPRAESFKSDAHAPAIELAKRGEELRRRWDLDRAEAAFNEAVAIDPHSLEAALGLARIARARIDYAGAIRLLNNAAKIRPNSADILAELGLTYMAAEETSRSVEYFERALRLNPANEAATIGKAGAELLAREYNRAESRLRDYIARNPQSSHAYSMLARVLIEKSKNGEAAVQADRAIALDQYNADAIYVLAFIKASERKPDEVSALARRAVSLDQFNAGARRLLSQYLDGQGGYEQKVSEAARANYERGCALRREAKLAEAVAEFEAALALEPRYYRALVALGDVWLRNGDYERAATASRLAIGVDPDGATAHLELSYAHRGLQEQARIKIGATDFSALFYRQTAPPSYELTREIFPNYRMLTRSQQGVIDRAVAPLAAFLPELARKRARHHLLAYDERVGDIPGLDDVAGDRTFDGRFYASVRGVGGRTTVSGIEYIDMAARGGFHTIAHEFAHQVHLTAMSKDDTRAIRNLYEQARKGGRMLDYYAGASEYEYFAQGYEAFISDYKRPSAGVTARHTRGELVARDPELYKFILNLMRRSGAAQGAYKEAGAARN